MVGGKVLTGPLLADLITKMVTALNSRDIPTVGSIMEFFNKEANPTSELDSSQTSVKANPDAAHQQDVKTCSASKFTHSRMGAHHPKP